MPFQQQGKKNFDKFFDKSVINKIGKRSGFVLRKARKISAYDFVLSFLISSCRNQTTFSSWALQIGLLSNKCVSKQGLFDRIHSGAVAFSKELLQKVILQQSTKNFATSLFTSFGKVLLHDSTTLRLPQVLASVFPGNRSGGEQKAVARIQSIIDIKAMKFINFVVGSFTQNDQSASGSVTAFVKKGDLVIRDMGYFVLSTFQSLIRLEVYFLSRLRYDVNLYDKQGLSLLLKDLLRAGKPVDKWVFIGAETRIWVRLIMLPLPAEQVNEKIRKAKKDRDKRLNHSKQYYQWLGYSVYITTVDKDTWTAKEVAKAYRVRWQIEIIFKSWKSGFHLQELLHEGCGNEHRVKVSIYLMLLFICLFMNKIYVRYSYTMKKQTNKKISLIKLAKFIAEHILEIFLVSHARLKEIISRYCCYDSRHDRINMTDLYLNVNS